MRLARVKFTLVAALALGASSPALADYVWSFHGNDTGGIIAWEYAQQIDAKKLAMDHCAWYGKLVKPLAVQPVYGGYISFACVIPRPGVVYPGAISVKG